MRSAILVLVLLLVGSPGCMMVRDGNVKPPAQWPPHSNQQVKKSIALHVIEAGRQAVSTQGPDAAEDFRTQAVKAYTESGLFSLVPIGIAGLGNLLALLAIAAGILILIGK